MGRHDPGVFGADGTDGFVKRSKETPLIFQAFGQSESRHATTPQAGYFLPAIAIAGFGIIQEEFIRRFQQRFLSCGVCVVQQLLERGQRGDFSRQAGRLVMGSPKPAGCDCNVAEISWI